MSRKRVREFSIPPSIYGTVLMDSIRHGGDGGCTFRLSPGSLLELRKLPSDYGYALNVSPDGTMEVEVTVGQPPPPQNPPKKRQVSDTIELSAATPEERVRLLQGVRLLAETLGAVSIKTNNHNMSVVSQIHGGVSVWDTQPFLRNHNLLFWVHGKSLYVRMTV